MDLVRRALAGTLMLIALQSACGSTGNGGLGEVGTYGDGGPSFSGGAAGNRGALDAHIEQNHVTVTFVTLSCAGPCADVVAVPTGGQAPYSFKWEDGSTGASRHLCPNSNTSYQVTVTDTGTSGELARPPETAQASVTADVLACPDAGPSDAGGGACISNSSFEGTPTAVCFFSPFSASPWVVCGSAADQACIVDASGGGITGAPPPTDGATDLVFTPAYTSLGNQFVSEPLCSPLLAGTPYSVRIDLNAFGSGGGAAPTPLELEIWGGDSACSEGELLWTSPPVAVGEGWRTVCATLTASRDATYLALASSFASGVDVAAGSAHLAVDHIVPVAACP